MKKHKQTKCLSLIFDDVLQIEDDAYQEDLGFSLGQLGKSGSGRVRQAQVNEATKARISKSLQVNSSMVHFHSYNDKLLFFLSF